MEMMQLGLVIEQKKRQIQKCFAGPALSKRLHIISDYWPLKVLELQFYFPG